MSKTIWYLLGACEPEIEPLRGCFEEEASVVVSDPVGVGLIDATLGTTRLFESLVSQSNFKANSLEVIFVGSLGCLSPDVPLLSAVNASSVFLGDYASASDVSYYPPQMDREISNQGTLKELFSEQNQFQCFFEPVYSPCSISKTKAAGELYREATNSRFENLELFGVASVCQKFHVPWSSLSLVTNYIGESAHHEWKDNREAAALGTAEILRSLLKTR